MDPAQSQSSIGADNPPIAEQSNGQLPRKPKNRSADNKFRLFIKKFTVVRRNFGSAWADAETLQKASVYGALFALLLHSLEVLAATYKVFGGTTMLWVVSPLFAVISVL